MTAAVTRLRRLAPWLAAALLLSVVFLRVDFGATARALASADWPRFVLSALPFAAIWLAIDAAALSRLVSRFHAPFGFRDMLRLRGGTYLFLVLSYDAAQAALALALSRRLRVPLLALGGTFLFYYAIDLLTIAASRLARRARDPGRARRRAAPGAGALLALVAGALRAWARGSPRSLRRADPRHAEARDAPRRRRVDGLARALLRLLRGLRGGDATGLRHPRPAAARSSPAYRSRSRSRRCPITVSGLGSAQVAMLALYGAFADEASIVAYSLAHSVSLVVLRLPIGLACWPAVARPPRPPAEPQLAGRSQT